MSEHKHNFIVVEGPSGSGKSTVMKGLQATLGWPCYRPFRGSADSHQPGEQEPALGRLGVPVNTFMEDLFTADVIASLVPNCILDRSMPSALAYDALGVGSDLGATKRVLALAAWARRVKAGRGLIVHVRCSPEVAAARTKRFDEAFITGETRHITEYVMMAKALGVDVIELDTTADGGLKEHLEAISQVL